MSSVNERRKVKAFEKALKRKLGDSIPTFFKFKVHSSFQDTYNSIVLPTGSNVTLPTRQELENEYNSEVTKEEERSFQSVEGDLQVGTANLYVNTSTSRVGVGKTNPSYTLDVNGDLQVGTANLHVNTSTSRVGVGKIDPSYTLDVNGDLQVGTANLHVNTSTSRVGVGKIDPSYTLDVNGDLQVGTANLYVNTSTSRVGVGKIDPSYTLDVNGSVYASGDLHVGTANLYVNTSTSRVGVGKVNPSYTLDVNGSVYASGDVIMFSDQRKKTNIKPITNALDKVLQLRGVTFDKIDDDTRRHAGIIAQEVEKVLPEVVYTDDDEMKSVAYGNLIALLIEAIKELTKS